MGEADQRPEGRETRVLLERGREYGGQLRQPSLLPANARELAGEEGKRIRLGALLSEIECGVDAAVRLGEVPVEGGVQRSAAFAEPARGSVADLLGDPSLLQEGARRLAQMAELDSRRRLPEKSVKEVQLLVLGGADRDRPARVGDALGGVARSPGGDHAADQDPGQDALVAALASDFEGLGGKLPATLELRGEGQLESELREDERQPRIVATGEPLGAQLEDGDALAVEVPDGAVEAAVVCQGGGDEAVGVVEADRQPGRFEQDLPEPSLAADAHRSSEPDQDVAAIGLVGVGDRIMKLEGALEPLRGSVVIAPALRLLARDEAEAHRLARVGRVGSSPMAGELSRVPVASSAKLDRFGQAPVKMAAPPQLGLLVEAVGSRLVREQAGALLRHGGDEPGSLADGDRFGDLGGGHVERLGDDLRIEAPPCHRRRA